MKPNRTPYTLHSALRYACMYAESAEERCATILTASRYTGAAPEYRVEDGRQPPRRDNETGLDWWPVYIIERPEDQDDVRKREWTERLMRGMG